MIEYSVNKEKRTVVAFIKFGEHEECFKDSSWILEKLYSALDLFYRRDTFCGKKYRELERKMFYPCTMSAKAKCNPKDEWDEEYGKQLARQRLVEKIKRYRSNSYCVIANLANEINEFVM
jgi:hypothetical protein